MWIFIASDKLKCPCSDLVCVYFLYDVTSASAVKYLICDIVTPVNIIIVSSRSMVKFKLL